jgi:uncharacterized protein (TIGR02646 family)
MRPIKRGNSAQPEEFRKYRKAYEFLVSRLGSYCSYCERRIPTGLAVEHIQPKKTYKKLTNDWTNLLLACVNCNSTKKDKNVILSDILLPDRDNTFAAFIYTADGRIKPSSLAVNNGLTKVAQDTLALTGLDKKISDTLNENGKEIALDRISQRKESWLTAQRAKGHIVKQPDNDALKEIAIEAAKQCGFFSIWMTVFENNADMRNRLIDAFAGTRDSGCFDSITTAPISPAPNPDGLANGGKL